MAGDGSRSLAVDVGIDVLAATGAGLSVAPFISLIDAVRLFLFFFFTLYIYIELTKHAS